MTKDRAQNLDKATPNVEAMKVTLKHMEMTLSIKEKELYDIQGRSMQLEKGLDESGRN